jgi:hypothetical protein
MPWGARPSRMPLLQRVPTRPARRHDRTWGFPVVARKLARPRACGSAWGHEATLRDLLGHDTGRRGAAQTRGAHAPDGPRWTHRGALRHPRPGSRACRCGDARRPSSALPRGERPALAAGSTLPARPPHPAATPGAAAPLLGSTELGSGVVNQGTRPEENARSFERAVCPGGLHSRESMRLLTSRSICSRLKGLSTRAFWIRPRNCSASCWNAAPVMNTMRPSNPGRTCLTAS